MEIDVRNGVPRLRASRSRCATDAGRPCRLRDRHFSRRDLRCSNHCSPTCCSAARCSWRRAGSESPCGNRGRPGIGRPRPARLASSDAVIPPTLSRDELKPWEEIVSLTIRPAARAIACVAVAVATLALAGCQKSAAQAEPPAADGRRRRVAADDGADPGRPRTRRPAPSRTSPSAPASAASSPSGTSRRARSSRRASSCWSSTRSRTRSRCESAKARQDEAEAALTKAEKSKGREVTAAQVALDQAQLVLAAARGAAQPGAADPQRRHARGDGQGRGRSQEGRGPGRGRPRQPRAGQGRLQRRRSPRPRPRSRPPGPPSATPS